MKGLATVWVLASALLAVLAPATAASTQRISITFAPEGAGSVLGSFSASL